MLFDISDSGPDKTQVRDPSGRCQDRPSRTSPSCPQKYRPGFRRASSGVSSAMPPRRSGCDEFASPHAAPRPLAGRRPSRSRGLLSEWCQLIVAIQVFTVERYCRPTGVATSCSINSCRLWSWKQATNLSTSPMAPLVASSRSPPALSFSLKS
jgi:hypothetical protein